MNGLRAGAALALTGLALVFVTPPAHGNIGVEWEPCECGGPTYTLTVNTLGYGTASKSPDRPSYNKGESVIVSFTPNADRVFWLWYCIPPSHLASLSEETAAVVFMTADTTLTAFTRAKTQTLYVDWDPSFGTVELPPGGQGGGGAFTVPVDYDDTITLTATPNSGYYTVWVGYNGTWGGERYGNSVNVKMQGTNRVRATFRPNAGYPPSMNTLTLDTTGGDCDVFCSGAPTSSFQPGPYPYLSATGPYRFSFLFSPRKGYAWKYLTWEYGGQTRYTTSTGVVYYPSGEFTGHLVDKIRLNIEVEGQGVVASPQFSYWWNPQPYYPVALTDPPATSVTPLATGNQVVMTPSACPGWSFDHWEYKNAQGQWISTPGNPLQGGALTVYMNWWTGAGIHVPDGHMVFHVKAVFVERGVDISLYATIEGCFQGYAERLTGGNSYAFTSGEQALEALQQATSQHCAIGNLFILSHAWIYNSISGQIHGGGFYNDPQFDNGVYGTSSGYDLPTARYLSDFQAAINNGSIKFADNPNLRVFLEGCRIGETGSTIAIPSSFVSGLAGIAGRPVVAACGGSSEAQLTPTTVKFLSAPGGTLELNDERYDGWIENGTEEGRYCTVPGFLFEN